MIFVLNRSRVCETFVSRGAMFHIFGRRYVSTFKAHLTVFTDPNLKSVCEDYVGYSSVQIFHALPQQLDFSLFYTALLLIFLHGFLHELSYSIPLSTSFPNTDALSLKTVLRTRSCK